MFFVTLFCLHEQGKLKIYYFYVSLSDFFDRLWQNNDMNILRDVVGMLKVHNVYTILQNVFGVIILN